MSELGEATLEAKNNDNDKNSHKNNDASDTKTTDSFVVKDLGRKARQRLEQEKSKRREIVRIDEPPPPERKSKSQQRCTIDTKTQNRHRQPRQPQPRQPQPRRRRQKRQSRSWASNRSTKRFHKSTPSIAHLLDNDESDDDDDDDNSNNGRKKQPSTLVRMHGLPLGCKPEDIRRFLLGLKVEGIYTALAQNHESSSIANRRIDAWDEKPLDGSSGSSSNGRRHAPSFRVYVGFVSAPLAVLATKRTGEELLGLSVAVTTVDQTTARYLLSNLLIPCPFNSTVSIAEIQQAVTDRLPPSVPQHLWDFATNDLGLVFDDPKEDDDDHASLSLLLLLIGRIRTCRKLVMNEQGSPMELMKLYNELVDEMEKLCTTSPTTATSFGHDHQLRQQQQASPNEEEDKVVAVEEADKLVQACLHKMDQELRLMESELRVLRTFYAEQR